MIKRKTRLPYTALLIPVVVIAAGMVGLENASGVAPTISANPTTIQVGRSTTVTWDHIANPTVKDWIGLYGSPQAPDTAFFAWKYTDSTFGISTSEPFLVPFGTPIGNQFQFRLFANDGFTRLATSGTIIINPPQANFGVSRGSLPRGSSQIVSWGISTPPSPTDWIGLYSSSTADDRAFLAFRYTDSNAIISDTAAAGSEPFSIPASAPPGSGYQFRMFSDNGFSRLATSGSFTVT